MYAWDYRTYVNDVTGGRNDNRQGQQSCSFLQVSPHPPHRQSGNDVDLRPNDSRSGGGGGCPSRAGGGKAMFA